VLAVADGMGGMNAGDYAAEIVIHTIEDTPYDGVYNEKALSTVLKTADRAIHEKSTANSDLTGMGSTATFALIRAGVLYWAHVGDSRLYIFREHQLRQITRDQNMAQFLVESGEITPEEAMYHPSRNHLDQSVGCGICTPDAGRLKVCDGDWILLTTDGLHGEVPAALISSVLDKSGNIEDKAKALVNAGLDAGGYDNITVVLCEI